MQSRVTEKFVRDFNQGSVANPRSAGATSMSKDSTHAHTPSAQPTFELIRDGDVVQAIDVTCSCGEKIRIWCSYAAQS